MSHFYNTAGQSQQNAQQPSFDLDMMLDIASNVLPGLAEQWPQFAAQAEQFAPHLFNGQAANGSPFGRCSGFARRAAATSSPNGVFSPKMDSEERPETNETVLTLELPGIPRDRVNIDVTGGSDGAAAKLVVSGGMDERPPGAKFSSRERTIGKFERTVNLPRGVTAEDIKADLADGLLTISYPLRKSVPEAEKTRVTVN
ncbi:HSP20-like chaperone [Auriculariales sp. MPI-PUGE-AT-0066]|nr:HSP20-like chaperone [Auriculariales sp. MPI-PUGE-AT-0066]